jgi:hypothetical protein
MACFGPLLLPPRPPPLPNGAVGRRSPGSTRLQRRRSSSTCRPPLSSTYLSFRDEADFEEVAPIRRVPPVPPPKPRAILLQRSHSEGNLKNLVAARTFNKCIRALSGSWKNLLQSWQTKDKRAPTLILPPPPNIQPLTPIGKDLHAS